MNSKILKLKDQKKLLQKQINALDADYSQKAIFFVGIEDSDAITSQEIKNKISMLKVEQTELVKSNEAVVIPAQEITKKSILNNNIKQMLKCFNSEAAFTLSNVTV